MSDSHILVTKPNGNGSSRHLSEKAIKKDGGYDWNHIETGVEFEGSKITLPDDPEKMPLVEAIKSLQRLKEDEDKFIDVSEVIDAYPLDGAVAFMMAMKKKYGWASPVPTPGFFGPKPPQMITVDVSVDTKIQVPWGSFLIPGIEKPVTTDVSRGEHGPTFMVYGSLRKKEVHLLKELADLTRQIVREKSIYKGKAIRIRTDESGDMNVGMAPTFIDTRKIKPEEIIMASDVEALIETNIFALIKHTAECRNANIPLKRGILLEGPYGTGKTLAAMATAKHCEEHGWTFLLLDRCHALKTALEFAKRYQPCAIFAEDIDRMTEERDEDANDLLNTIDGGLSKNSEIMVVLTTNHVEKINKAMLRPGRLDAVISVSPPDAVAAQKLLRLYARGRLDNKIDLTKIGTQLSGSTPAVIREVVERSKLAMIGRGDTMLNEDDLIVSATGMEHHRKLLADPARTEPTSGEMIGIAIVDLVKDALGRVPQVVVDANTHAELAMSEASDASSKAASILTVLQKEAGPLAKATKAELDGLAMKTGVAIYSPEEFR